MLCALIMAGGKGSRFWPLSTEEKPKQFLNLIGEETMIQMTVNRIKPIIPIEKIFVCTGKQYVELVKKQLPDLPEKNIIVEPVGRNTAPCIALSALVIERYYKGANMVVLPSDHLIKKEEVFRNIVKTSNEFVDRNNSAIITLGMSTTRAETGYGYIRCGKETQGLNKHKVIKVDAFVEKPNKEVAKKYLEEANYLWNGGMFVWSVKNIINLIKKYSRATYEALHEIEEVKEEQLQELINSNYKNTEAISIDYAVLEKYDNTYVVPSDIGWDDVGSWNALDRYRTKDENGNILLGNAIHLDSLNNIIVSQEKKIVISGIKDIYVLESENSIVIGRKVDIEKVKNIRESVGL